MMTDVKMSVNTTGIRTTTTTRAVVSLPVAVGLIKNMDNRIAELKKQIAIAEAAVKAASAANLNYVKQNADNMVATAKADAARASASLVLELSAINTSHLKTMDELAANNATSENKLSEALAIDAPENDADAVKRADAAVAELAKAKDAEKAQDDADAAAQAVYAAAAAAAAAQAKDAAAAAAAAQAKAAAEAKDAAAKTAAAAAAAQAKAADDAKDAAAKTAAAAAAAATAAAAVVVAAAAVAAAAAAVAAEKDKLINGLKAKLSDVQFVNTFLAPIELEYIQDTKTGGLTIKEKTKIIAEIALYPAAKAAADKAAADKAAAAAAAAAAKVEAEKKAAAEAAAAAAAAKAKAEAEAKVKAEAAAKAAAKAAADKAAFDKLDLNANGELTQMEFDGTQDKIDWYRAVDMMDLSISSYELLTDPNWKLPAGRAEYTLLKIIYVDQSLIEAISGNSFDHWVKNGKKIPEDFVFVGASIYFNEATGTKRTDQEVYNLIFSKIVLYGFIAEDKNGDVFVSFRGTEGFYEWVEDFKVYAQSCSFLKNNANAVDAKVHRGFNDIYDGCYVDKVKGESVRTYLFGLLGQKTNNILYLTGHSLGAAVAALGACDMVVNAANVFKKVIVYNYASPKLSNKAFNTFFSKQVPNAFWRMYNENDLVPQLPPPSLLPGNAGNDYESLEVGYQVNFGNELPNKIPLGAYKTAVNANHSALAYQKAVYAAYVKARDEGNNGLLGVGDTTNVDLNTIASSSDNISFYLKDNTWILDKENLVIPAGKYLLLYNGEKNFALTNQGTMNVFGELVATGGIVDPCIINQGILIVESGGKILNYGGATMINFSTQKITNNGDILSRGNIINGGTINNNNVISLARDVSLNNNSSLYGTGTFLGNPVTLLE